MDWQEAAEISEAGHAVREEGDRRFVRRVDGYVYCVHKGAITEPPPHHVEGYADWEPVQREPEATEAREP